MNIKLRKVFQQTKKKHHVQIDSSMIYGIVTITNYTNGTVK